jgi:thiol-disulfide isomerase/thioredoxin
MRARVKFVLLPALVGVVALHAQGSAQTAPPRTPTACLAAVRADVAKRQKDAAAAPPSMTLADEIARTRTALAAQCTARFDVKTTADTELASLIELYSLAAQPTQMTAAVDRALTAASLSEHDRAAVLLQAIQVGLAEPKGDERKARLEQFVDRLDKLPDAAAFDQKFSAHQRMGIYYRGDDIDAGIVKHSTWIIDAAKRCTPDQRKKYTSAIVSAYLNMAQSLAGQGQTDRAIALLRRAPADLPDIPSVTKSARPDLERLQLVGTAAAPITAPRWLNMPAGTKTLDLKGQVTLLEFSAHWCVPCKKSYPALNRLRQKFGGQGFRVVLATELYGFFERETELAAAAEVERDRAYFAANHLDVPIAINDGAGGQDENPNSLHYKVGGIPQIQLVDKRGIIRLISVGYDDSNEATFAKIIETLLKER